MTDRINGFETVEKAEHMSYVGEVEKDYLSEAGNDFAHTWRRRLWNAHETYSFGALVALA